MSDEKQLSDINRNLLTLIDLYKEDDKKKSARNLKKDEDKEIKKKDKGFIGKSLSNSYDTTKDAVLNNSVSNSIKELPAALLGMLLGKGINIPSLIEKQLKGALRPSNIITKPGNYAFHKLDELSNWFLKSKDPSEKDKEFAKYKKEIEQLAQKNTTSAQGVSDKLVLVEKTISTHAQRTNELLGVIAKNSIESKADSGGYSNQTDYYKDLEKHGHGTEGNLEGEVKGKVQGALTKEANDLLESGVEKEAVSLAEKKGIPLVEKIFGKLGGKILGGMGKAVGKLIGVGLKSVAKVGLGAIPIIGWLFDIGSILSMIWNPIKGLLYAWAKNNPLETKIVETMDAIISPISDFFGKITDFVTDLFSGNGKALQDLRAALSDIHKFLTNGVNLLFSPITALFKTLYSYIKDNPAVKVIAKGIDTLFGWISKIINYVEDKLEGWWDTITGSSSPKKSLASLPSVNSGSFMERYEANFSNSLPTPLNSSIGSNIDNDSSELTKGMSSADLSSNWGKLQSQYGYQALGISAESEGNFGAIGSIPGDPGGISLGAFQFSGDGNTSSRAALINLLKAHVNDFTNSSDKDLINNLDNNNLESVISNPDSRKRLEEILRSPLGQQLQQQLATSDYYTPMMGEAANIKIGNSNLAALANSDPKLKAALFSRQLNQPSVLKHLASSGKSWNSSDDFLKDFYATSSTILAGTSNSSKVKASVQNRLNQEYTYASGGKVGDFSSSGLNSTSDTYSVSTGVNSLIDSTTSGANPINLSSIMSNASIMRELNKAVTGHAKSTFSPQLNIPSSSSIKPTIDHKEVEKQQLQALSAIHNSSVATNWDLDSLPYDSHMAALNSGELT